VAAAAILGSCVAALPAQNLNMTLLKSWDRASNLTYNDIWGYTAPDGREFAYVGETRGIWIVETTDGANPVQRAWWSAPSSSWRDFTSYKQYAYAATENKQQRGFRVIDMSNPDAPVDVGYVQTATMISAHNVSCDPATGLIYFSGSNQGVAIYDAKANPLNPPLIANWQTTYTHDICVRRGRGYFSIGSSYQVRILDISGLPISTAMPTIGNCNTPGGYAHNAWISEDDQLLVATDEIARGSVSPHMTVWDVSNPANPNKVGDYDLGSASIAHNAFLIGRTAFMSYYTDGIHMIDLADPTNPTRIGNWDTSTVSGGYAGAWGCYPFADSGLIYGSDMQNGLFILQADCGAMNRYGTGTPGSTGTPRARFDGASPKVGAAKLRFEIEHLEPNRNFWMAISVGKGTGNVLGAQINVDLFNGAIIGPIQATASGTASVAAPVPNNAGIGGGKVYFQVFGDRGDGTLTASRGMWTGICR
jgi:choice-of-anchor B domain-containing protein